MKRKAKELQAARITAGKGRSLLGGFGSGQAGGGGGGYPNRQDNSLNVGDTATPLETPASKSYSNKYVLLFSEMY